MSSAKRAYDILRGYVNYGWDQLQDGPESEAERELRTAIEQPIPQSVPAKGQEAPREEMTVEVARRLLGVDASSTSKQIQRAFDDLSQAVDPKKFSADAPAEQRARDLQARLRAALRVLQANVDPTVRRFEGLEIE